MLTTFKPSQQAIPASVAGVEQGLLTGLKQEKLRFGDLRQAAFWVLSDVLHLLRTRRWKVDYEATNVFQREQELPYLESATVDEVTAATREALMEIIPTQHDMIEQGLTIVLAMIEASDSTNLLESLKLVHSFYEQVNATFNAPSFFVQSAEKQNLFISTDAAANYVHGSCTVSWPTVLGSCLVEAVRSHVVELRTQQRHPTFSEFVVEHVAYHFLATGRQLGALAFTENAKFLGTVGFRAVTQTYPSLTDPGDGHIFGTTRKAEWMNGAIVHVEHLERPGGVPRTLIESYRIPAILDFARTRLHTSGAMPNTYFTGRALRDSAGSFQQSFIKVVNTTSAALSQAFSLGAAECKIAMDDLSTSQIIAYLRALAGHTLRQPHQYLSCAFNLNWPIVDDSQHDVNGNILPPRLVTDPFEIAKLAIEIATSGGFDKVTWDGASDTYPSKCIIHQLTFPQWLYLAHRAHECGLTTYTSAGFKFPQICYGVWAGIDGLGIGGAQILRHMDHQSGMHGPYTEENLDRVLGARDDAAAHLRGQGAALLARLDRMFFEGSLKPREDALRLDLFAVLAKVDECCIRATLNHPLIKPIAAMTDDGERPYVAWAQRLLRNHVAHEECLLQSVATFGEWDALMTQLTLVLGSYAPTSTQSTPPDAKTAPMELEEEVYDVHLGRTWTQLRLRKAKELSAGHALSRHDNVVKIKTTPFSSNAESRRSSRRSSLAPSAVQSPVASRRPSTNALYSTVSLHSLGSMSSSP